VDQKYACFLIPIQHVVPPSWDLTLDGALDIKTRLAQNGDSLWDTRVEVETVERTGPYSVAIRAHYWKLLFRISGQWYICLQPVLKLEYSFILLGCSATTQKYMIEQ